MRTRTASFASRRCRSCGARCSVASFRGWNDGGHGASLAGAFLAQGVEARSGSPRSIPSASSTSRLDAAADLARRGHGAADRLARERLPRRAARAGDRRTSCCCSAPSRASAGARSAALVTGLAPRARRRAGRDARLAARRRAAHAARAGDRERDRPEPRSSSSACRPPATRARPGSSACSTTRAARPASRRCRSGPRSRTTSR